MGWASRLPKASKRHDQEARTATLARAITSEAQLQAAIAAVPAPQRPAAEAFLRKHARIAPDA